MKDVIRVQAWHYKGQVSKGPKFEIHEQEGLKVELSDEEKTVSLTSGNLSVRVNKEAWNVEFFYKDKFLTGSGHRHMAYITTQDEGPFMREQLDLDVGECVYGLGERFTAFVKNGQVVDIWNRDGGTSSEQAYKNIPFYITNRGYGVFVNHPEEVSFEVASEVVSRVQFSVPGEYLDYFVIGGSDLKEVLENYTTLTGKPALPPAWSFGLWLTTSFTTSYDEKTVSSFIDGMAERDIPLHVFHFDCFWMREFQWCDFEWDNRVFPEPAEMLKRLKEKGLRICVWINPYIGQKSRLFDEGMEKGYFIKKPNGDVWQWDLWQPGMAIVDFTNPDACRWYASKLEKLLDMGVDCFKTDFGERIPTDVVYFDGSDPVKMHNYYAYLYNKVVFDTLERKLGKGKAVVFARSGTAGSQQFPVHWGGDCNSTYASMAETLRGGLSLCLSGFAFWSHDISGFENTATPDLYKRWAAFGLLSSHSRLHGSSSYRVPWLFDEEAVDVVRFFTKLKCSLMPYLYATACTAARRGIPTMRAMVLEFTDDPACDYLDRQYMLGDSLLVAPVFKENGDVAYYLPKGTWTHFLTGRTVQGGSWQHENHDYFSLPLMVRPNSIIAVGKENSRPDYDFADGVTLHVFQLEDGKSAEAVVYNMEGKEELKLSAKRCGNEVEMNWTGAGKPFSILMRGVSKVDELQGAVAEADELGVKLIPNAGATGIRFLL